MSEEGAAKTIDARDLALRHLAEDETAIVDFAADLQSDLETTRLLLSVTLEQLHYVTELNRRLRETVRRQTAVIRDYIDGPAKPEGRAA
jgi:hypothetical protein